MITEEQIENLKPGDPLIIHGTFEKKYEDGDISIEVMVTEFRGDGVVKETIYCNPSCVSLPSPYPPLNIPIMTEVPQTYPKYDPCREFKVGDKVRMMIRDGRYPYCHNLKESIVPTDIICTVTKRECNGFVEVEYYNGYNPVVHFSFLELVTPVEEIKQFYLESDNNMLFYIYFGTEQNYELVSRLDKKYYSLTDAQAECDRLNTEYRKEQNNG